MTQPRPSGERYGDYELTRYLTAGGMADLWLARHPRFGGDLVIKRIQPRYVEMTRVVKMFIDEGRIAQALDHPNIVKVVDVGHHDGVYFIAMEYIPGRDLLAICRRGVEVGDFLSRPLAVAILAQAVRGLVYAHEKRDDHGKPLEVVHCDISPGNIVVAWGGTVKLVDFGIARATIMLREEDESVAGKYNYMAPEQIRGEAVDQRADLFSIGIMLYELTVGKRLFRGRPEQVMRLVLEEPIERPSALRPDYPASLEAIVMRCLERDRAARYQTARELRADLVEWLYENGDGVDKRAIAGYLRAIFGAQKQREADEFAGEAGDEDDELVLERSLSGWNDELRVDPEDPPDEPATASAAGAAIAATPADAGAVATATAAIAAAEQQADVAELLHDVSAALDEVADAVDHDAETAKRARVEPEAAPAGAPLASAAPLVDAEPMVETQAKYDSERRIDVLAPLPLPPRRSWLRRLLAKLFGK